MLSSRSQALIKLLLDSENPLRVKDIAQEFGVSSRTIKYDLEAMRSWLQTYDLELQSQPNKGIWISNEPTIRKRIQTLLKENDASVVYYYQSDRVKLIVLDLLLLEGAIRIADWMDHFHVSRNTVQSDLVLVEVFLKEWEVSLVRNREGIQVQGSERQKRLALEYSIQDSIESNAMIQMVHAVTQQSDRPERLGHTLGKWFRFVNESDAIFKAVVKVNRLIGEELEISLTDRAIIGIYIRLCIVINRLSQGCKITLKNTEFTRVKKFGVYRIFQSVLCEWSILSDIEIPEHEIAYVCLPAIGSISDETDLSLSFDLFELTVDLVRELSVLTNVDFNQDPDLLYPLFKHISDKMAKFQHGVVEANPLVNEISRNYKTMFDHVKQSCQHIFEPHGVHFTDSDLAYIVLHFQASLERIEESKKYRVLVVCSTGRGLARLLKNKLEHGMKNISVVGSCSVLEAEKMAKFHDADLIVSMLPVVSSKPVIEVHPIPTKQDMQEIEKVLKEIPASRPVKQQHDIASIEEVNQNMIQQGLELAKEMTTEFAEYLPEQRSEGLFYHILFMVNRLMFGKPYPHAARAQHEMNEKERSVRRKLLQLLSEKGIEIPEGEVEAILHYFVL